MTSGDPIHGEIDSANASSTPAIALLYKAGSTSAFTLASTQFITITDLILNFEGGGDIVFHAGAVDAAGIRIFKGNMVAKGGLTHRFKTPFLCPKGVTPRITADSGQVDLTFTGTLSEA